MNPPKFGKAYFQYLLSIKASAPNSIVPMMPPPMGMPMGFPMMGMPMMGMPMIGIPMGMPMGLPAMPIPMIGMPSMLPPMTSSIPTSAAAINFIEYQFYSDYDQEEQNEIASASI